MNNSPMTTPTHLQTTSKTGGPVIQCRNLSKIYTEGPVPVDVLSSVDFNLAVGEQVAIVGASGSGKSTLLHLLGGLDLPTRGEVQVVGRVINYMDENARGLLRNQTLGFVYQFHHLLMEFTAVENVAMPLLIRGVDPRTAEKESSQLLERVGMGHRLQHKPNELSGGERQRAALARALVTKPKCVMADEPTGNLDHKTAEQVYALMLELNRDFQTSFLVVTHDVEFAAKMDRVLHLRDGCLHNN